ncbi:MAG: citrate synthase [Desulforhopalus sp.]
MPQEFATLTIRDNSYKLPIIVGTRGDRAIDIRPLLKQTGHITLDSGYMNTGACTSSITYLDGAKGILDYRGYAIEDLAAKCTFTEVAYLILHGELPTFDALENFKHDMRRFALLHEDMIHFFDNFPPNSSPMSILSTTVNILHNFYPEMDYEDDPYGGYTVTAARLLAKARTIAAFSYKKSIGHPLVYPSPRLNYCENFLNMMFDRPNLPYKIKPEFVTALNKLLILHADHEQNCSTSTVRLVGSSGANLYASISAGISALWGPLHGGANQAVIEMLQMIHKDGSNFQKYLDKAKDKKDPFRLTGFGHRVYKTFDPRAKIIKAACYEIMEDLEIHDPLLDIALELEEIVSKDEYFVKRHLYPNVDFFSGIIYRAMGIPTNMFTVMFALGRLPGWIAQWTEMNDDIENARIGRPRQIYSGNKRREFVPMKHR